MRGGPAVTNVSPRRRPLACLTLAAALAACSTEKTNDNLDAGTSTDGGVFLDDDHTTGSIATESAFFALANRETPRAALKVVVTEFARPAKRAVRYMDGNFYRLHDEWYWFRLLNGWSVPGADVAPISGLSFESIAHVYAWARLVEKLPLDLRFVSESRLYSPKFYELSFGRDRAFGLATLLHIPERPAPNARPERFLFELEYTDALTHPELVGFFEALGSTLPAPIAKALAWVIRSPEQETLAKHIEAEKLPYWDRIVRYRDFVVPGETEVYSAGIAAGRLRFIRSGE